MTTPLTKFDVAIIGGGSAGSMGALRAVLNNLKTVAFLGSALTKKRARATWVGKVENMPGHFGMPKAIIQSANEVFQWIEKSETWAPLLTSVRDEVIKISGQKGDFRLETKKGEIYQAKYVVLCTGIMDVQPVIGGDIKNVYPMANEGHVEYCIRCDGHRAKGKHTAIIGHAESAAWIATLLKERYECPAITVLTNGEKLAVTPGTPLADRIAAYDIQVKESPIQELAGNAKKEGLTAILLADGTTISATIAFVSLGVIVYNELAKALGAKIDDRGYVLTDDAGETSVQGLFAAGDLRANKKKQIYTAWDITVDSVDKVDSYLRVEKRERLLKTGKHGSVAID